MEKAYLRRIVDAVNDFDNVLFEVSNENYYNLEWELSIAKFVHDYEKGKPRQHLVMPLDLPDHDYGGVTYSAAAKNDHTKSWKTWDLAQLHDRMLAARGLKQPLIYDTDGIESDDNPVQRKGFWTAFVSGGHVNYTDYSFQPEIGGDERGPRRAELRRQLGHLASFTRQVRFWEMHPADIVRSGDGVRPCQRARGRGLSAQRRQRGCEPGRDAGQLAGKVVQSAQWTFQPAVCGHGRKRPELSGA